MRDEEPEGGWRAEHYYPMGYLTTTFRRRPYANMTYEEAIDATLVELWNISNPPEPPETATEKAMVSGAELTREKLNNLFKRFSIRHPEYPNRSQALVHEFSNLWRGPVTTILTWFKRTGGE